MSTFIVFSEGGGGFSSGGFKSLSVVLILNRHVLSSDQADSIRVPTRGGPSTVVNATAPW